jgi:O-antigen ligase
MRPSRRLAWAVLGAVVGLVGGVLAARHSSTALYVCVAIGGVVALAMLGDRAFPWAIVIMVVAPWYPFTAHADAPGGINQKFLCTAIAVVVLMPWLWSIAVGGRRTRPNRGTLLMGVLYAALTILIYNTLGGIKGMVTPVVAGYIFAGVAFLCSRRFVEIGNWAPAGFAGMVILLLLGAEAYASAPTQRVGYFVGYPITYGGVLVGLLPIALVYSFKRSRGLAGAIALGTAAMLVFSESRSAWIATGMVLLVVIALLVRGRNARGLALVGAALVLALGLVLGTGSLHKVIENRVNAKTGNSESVTHRLWSFNYALGQIGQKPFFGAGAPGFGAEEAEARTNIGAIDNGYLSVSLDMGVVGLLAALIPIAIALVTLARCLRLGVAPPIETALALGIFGMAVVTLFYDSFYWPQMDLLFGAMGGALSLRVGALRRAPGSQLPEDTRSPLGRRGRPLLLGGTSPSA